MYRLAIDAGHYLGTAGRRCVKSLDPNETREWRLNDRIADKLEKILAEYDGIETFRTDDTTGKSNVPLSARANAANLREANFFLSLHANAADIKEGATFAGGGISVYANTKASKKSYEMQTTIYTALIAHTGLKGNRANPCAKANHYVTRETKMPAVLVEMGFMNSSVDVPIILSEDFANKAAQALAEVFIKESGATKKQQVRWCVQVGSFVERQNAEYVSQQLKKAGYDTYIKKV